MAGRISAPVPFSFLWWRTVETYLVPDYEESQPLGLAKKFRCNSLSTNHSPVLFQVSVSYKYKGREINGLLTMLVFSVTPFKIDQNKNQNRSIDKVQNLGNERR